MAETRWTQSISLIVAITNFVILQEVTASTTNEESFLSTVSPSPVARLVGGSTASEGRLEVFYNGEWGTVCDDGFDDRDADVACRMLGLSGWGVSMGNTYGQGTGRIWLDDLDCSGTEASLDGCRHSGLGTHNCGHNEDISIGCVDDSSCNITLSACDAIFRVDVSYTFRELISGRITPDSLSAECSHWSDCEYAASNSGCSLDIIYYLMYNNHWYDLSSQNNYRWYYYTLRRSVDSLNFMCNNATEGYSAYYDCFTSHHYDQIVQRCEAIQSAKQRRPFHLTNYYCFFQRENIHCVLSESNGTCSSDVAYDYVTYSNEYQKRWNNWYCNYDVNYLQNYTKPVLPGCNDNDFFFCFYHLYDSHDLFFYMAYYGSSYSYDYLCSNWASFQTCISTTGCTLDGIQYYVETIRNTTEFGNYNSYDVSRVLYYRIEYRSTFETYEYLCGDGRDLLGQSCSMNAYACTRATDTAMGYPYYYHNKDVCRLRYEDEVCSYQIASENCDKAVINGSLQLHNAFNNLWFSYERWYTNWNWYWQQLYEHQSCAFDVSEVENTQLSDEHCESWRIYSCLDQSSVRYYMYYHQSTAYYLLNGYLNDGWLSHRCSIWDQLIGCAQCNDTTEFLNNVDFVPAFIEYNGYLQYNDEYQEEQRRTALNEILTPNRFELLCHTDRQVITAHEQCFLDYTTEYGGGFYSVFYNCKSEALMSSTTLPSNDTAHDKCSFYESWFQCLYLRIIGRCSADAGAFVMQYFLIEWTKYLLENESCLLDMSRIKPPCDENGCISSLVSMMNQSVPLLKSGQLTDTDMGSFCSKVQTAAQCVTTMIDMECIITSDVNKYLALVSDVTPYLCQAIKQNDYLLSQPCYAQQSAATELILDQFFTNYSCPSSRQWLFSLYNTVNASCGLEVAGSVAGLAAQFHAVLDLSSTVTRHCANVLHPTENAAPFFEGPVIINQTGTSIEDGCIDYYFLCRISYSAPETDDGARFDVSLTFDGQLASTYRTTTSQKLDVMFTQDDLIGHFGTTVSCAVRSYWINLPNVKTDFVPSTRSYFVGIRYWSDIFTANTVQIAESAKSSSVYFQATVPITCSSCSLTLQLSRHNGLIVSSCSVTFSSADQPMAVHSVAIKALQTPGSNSRYASMNFDKVSAACDGSPWAGYQLADIPVLVVDHVLSSSCASDGDPHIRTFDYRFYSVYFTGDFLLWKSYGDGNSPVEVNVRFQYCLQQTVSCNCAVAFREGNNIVGVYACDPNKPPIVIQYLRDPRTRAPRIHVGNNGLYFYITMPSGRSMSVSSSCTFCGRLSITLYAVSADIGQSEGLCGNYNGLSEDDTIPKGSSAPDQYYNEPIFFARSYMLNANSSLINGHIYFPECIEASVELPVQCQCGDTDPGNCDFVSSAGGTVSSAVTFRTQGTNGCISRFKRQTDDIGPYIITPDEMPPQDPGIPPDEPLHGNGTVDSGVTEEDARHMCEEPLLNSPIYSQCAVFTAGVKDAIVGSCVLDVQLTGTAEDIIDGILSKYCEACVRGVQESDNRTVEEAVRQHNETGTSDSDLSSILQTPESAAILSALASQICPGQPECSGNGTCSNATCSCYAGYVGYDCSLLADVPPTITGHRFVSPCDVRDSRNNNEHCRAVALFVSEASLSSSTFACMAVTSADTYYPIPDLVNAREIRFNLPVTPLDNQSTSASYVWTVSISNDNVTFSNEIQLVVYDSKCLVCTDASSSCQRKVSSCLINGKCYSDGDVNPTDVCYGCSSQISSDTWTPGYCELETASDIPISTFTTTTKTQTTSSAETGSTPAGPLVTWGDWGDWSKCGSECNGRVSRRSRTCRNGDKCIGNNTEILSCLTDDCPELPEEKSEGFVITTHPNQGTQLTNSSFVVHFFDVMVTIVNQFCNHNKQNCCEQLLPGVNIKPVGLSMTVATRSATNIARGFPRQTSNTGKTIKVLMKSTRSHLLSQCSDSSRRRRETGDTEVYLNKDILAQAINSDVDTLQRETGMTILSVAQSTDTPKSGAGWTDSSVPLLLMVVLMWILQRMAGNI